MPVLNNCATNPRKLNFRPGAAWPYRDRYTGRIKLVFPSEPIERYPLGFFDEPSCRVRGMEPKFQWDDIPAEEWEKAHAFNHARGTDTTWAEPSPTAETAEVTEAGQLQLF